MTGKVMKWGLGHTDYYKYSIKARCWVQADCSLPLYALCAAPNSFPRGTEFDGTFNREGVDAEEMLDRFVVTELAAIVQALEEATARGRPRITNPRRVGMKYTVEVAPAEGGIFDHLSVGDVLLVPNVIQKAMQQYPNSRIFVKSLETVLYDTAGGD